MPRSRREYADRRGRGARRSEASASLRTARTRRAALRGRGRNSGQGSDCWCPPWRVLALPVRHRRIIALDMARRGIDAQRATRPLRDVAEVAEQHALRPFLDRLAERCAGANRGHEVLDVQAGHVVVGTDVETVTCLRREILLDDRVLEVIDDIPVAVHHHASGRAEDCGTARATVGGQAVAALSLPDDGLPAGELE